MDASKRNDPLRPRRAWPKLLLLVLGLGLFAWFVHRAGPGEILAVFSRLGWWLPVILVPLFVVSLIDALGWYFAFVPGRRPSYLTVLRIRWAGEAVNNLIPTAYVGGEALKAWLMRKRGVPLGDAATSVVVSKTLQVAAQVLFIALGATLAFTRLPPDGAARRAFAIVAVLAFAVILLLFWIQSVGLFSFVRKLTVALRLRALAARETQFRELDERIFGFYREHRGACGASGAAYFVGWLVDATEVYLVSHLLGFPIDYPTALAIESFISVAKSLGVFIPGALGVQESGVWLLFGLFGLTEPQALAYALLRRGREVFFTALGTALLYAEGGSLRGFVSPPAQTDSNSTAAPTP